MEAKRPVLQERWKWLDQMVAVDKFQYNLKIEQTGFAYKYGVGVKEEIRITSRFQFEQLKNELYLDGKTSQDVLNLRCSSSGDVTKQLNIQGWHLGQRSELEKLGEISTWQYLELEDWMRSPRGWVQIGGESSKELNHPALQYQDVREKVALAKETEEWTVKQEAT